MLLLARGKPGGGTGTVTGAKWTDSSAPVAKTTGRVFFTLGGRDYSCSGSAVLDNSVSTVSLVLTAGHCVWDDTLHFASNWMFDPGYTNGTAPYGHWTATALFTTSGWHAAGGADWPDDAGIAVVEGDTTGQTLAQRLQVALPSVDTSGNYTDSSLTYSAFGYPAAQKYKGVALTYCQGPVQLGLDGDNTVSMACDMTGGSSGGPWYDHANGVGKIKSLNSYGYLGIKRMFGPTFDTQEGAMLSAAGNGVCNNGEVCSSLAS